MNDLRDPGVWAGLGAIWELVVGVVSFIAGGAWAMFTIKDAHIRITTLDEKINNRVKEIHRKVDERVLARDRQREEDLRNYQREREEDREARRDEREADLKMLSEIRGDVKTLLARR